MSQSSDKKPKIGAGHMSAMLRQGLKEIQAMVYADSNIGREPEVGTFGNPTQSQIVDQQNPDKAPSVVDAHVQDARASKAAREQPSREVAPPEPEVDRD